MAPVQSVTSSLEFQQRVAAALFGVGSLIGFTVVVLPHPPQVYEPAFYAVGTLAGAGALMFHLGRGRLPAWTLPVSIAIGTLLISCDTFFSGERAGSPAADNEMLYLWVVLFAAYFFPRRQAILQVALIAVSYWVVLALSAPADVFATRWAETIGTLAVAAWFVQILRDRVEELVGRLSDAARTDPLTGLGNRRRFEELMEVEVERAQRTGASLALVVCDLDHFKRVNDRLGHARGDEALVTVGRILTTGKRQIDSAARTGGEEFTIVLPDTEAHGAYVVAERLRSMVEREFASQTVPLTLSIGLATYPDQARTGEELLAAADQALYAAKQLGRNRSVIHSEEIASISPEGRAGELHVSTILSLAEALDLRDTGTADHSQTVGRYCALVARELGLPAARVERLRIAGVVHDIGKIGLPDQILRKPGPLTAAEWAEMRRHPEIGAGILGSQHCEDIASWVLAHHERPDGSGYPRGLAGDELSLEARIIAVADAYEAMTADRVYRASLGPERARQELLEGAGEQFDERVVWALLTALEGEAAGRRAPLAAERFPADRLA